jgi:DNA ligase-1
VRFHELVSASGAVAQTPGRLEKISRLAEVLKEMRDDEIEIGVAYLSGSLLQGRIGLGWSAISAARMSGAADTPGLELREVNAIFDRIARVSGAGASRERARLAGELFADSTRDEQDFLVRLLSGDLRQGALEGVLT